MNFNETSILNMYILDIYYILLNYILFVKKNPYGQDKDIILPIL